MAGKVFITDQFDGQEQAQVINRRLQVDAQLTGGSLAGAQDVNIVQVNGTPVPETEAGALDTYVANGFVQIRDAAGGIVADVLANQALATGPKRSSVNFLMNSQVFNNVTTAANSTTFVADDYRYLCVFLQMALAGSPSLLRFIPQFSTDGGTTWFNYAVDQWVDLRYVAAQLPLNEVIPLNYVIPARFRMRVEASGTTAVNTFTVSVMVMAIT